MYAGFETPSSGIRILNEGIREFRKMLFTECIIRFACGIHQPIEILEKLGRSSCLLHASYVSSAVSTSHFLVIRKSMSLLTGPSKLRALQCLNFLFAPALGRGYSKHTFEIVKNMRMDPSIRFLTHILTSRTHLFLCIRHVGPIISVSRI